MNNIKGYESVFISSTSIYNLGIIFIFVTIVLFYFIYKVKELKKSSVTSLLIKYPLYFLLIGFFVSFIISIYEIYKVKNIFKNNTFLIAKGSIEKFYPMNKFGHENESFIVDGVLFKIHYTGNPPNKKTLFYTMTKNIYGPIKRNNQQVIIYYIKLFNSNKIIRLYIKNEEIIHERYTN